jgi:hypothetical protein
VAYAKNEPAIMDWYDPIRGPLIQEKYYPEKYEAVALKPESVISGEIGIGFHSLTYDIKANYYYTQFYNKIASVVDINDRRTTLNAGHALYQGIEGEVRMRMDRFDMTVSATFARNRWNKITVKEMFDSAAEDVIGKVVPFSPERMFSASVGYTVNPRARNKMRLGLQVNYWDEYYGTYTNNYIRTERIIGPDNLPYFVGKEFEAKLPYFLDMSAQCSYTFTMHTVDVTFRIHANNLLNRADNFMRAQYTVDYTRNDMQAGRYNWYVLQAPLYNIFFTLEMTVH